MHHKFLVVGGVADADCPDEDRTATGWEPVFEPAAVWTGSFNFTNNGGDSIENAVIIHDPVIATAYLNEWAQVFALSEPLDWESEYIAPEWRIGT
jgi:phosphatidylserine/phosphatidylglycerophosphate/cardiolipin synthase-like enzyme